ncbi:MAG TPA: NAD(P)-dependent oxidoreductase, partial [Dongiaceae bacterium]|nr:NAD(P)-dependent oxidoreductase [Dongiaceae bacterium]
DMDPQKVGFIGIGIMGRPMAGHILKAGHPLAVYNRTPGKTADLAAAGARVAASPADAARGADVVIVMVTDSDDVEAVVTGPGGVIEGIDPGAVVVDMSTISPRTERRLAERLRERGADLVDAPVSGGDVGARNATLAIMAGGEAASVEKVLPVLKRVGKAVTHCGPVGAGQLAKQCNQILVGVTLLAVSEAIALARAGGLEPEVMIRAVEGGAAASWQLSNLGPRILRGDFDPGFMVDLMQKDLRLVLETAAAAARPLPATALVHGLFGDAQAQGEGRMGTQILGKVVDRLAAGRAG